MIKINWIMGALIGALFLFLPMCIVWLHEARTLTEFALVGWGMIAAIVCITETMEACDKPAVPVLRPAEPVLRPAEPVLRPAEPDKRSLPRNTRHWLE